MIEETIPRVGRPSKGSICPRCGKLGSGLHKKWVLNESGRKYYPYYWFAHSVKKKGEKALDWCYIRKKIALKILGDAKLLKKFNLEVGK